MTENQVKINTTTSGLAQDFQMQYNSWRVNESAYHPHTPHSIRIIDAEDGIPCYDYDDVDAINQNTESIACIFCMYESINMYYLFEKYRKDCHYIILSGGWWDVSKCTLDLDYEMIYFPYIIPVLMDSGFSFYKSHFYANKEYDFTYPKKHIFTAMTRNYSPKREYLIPKIRDEIKYDNYVLRYKLEDLKMPTNPDDEPTQFADINPAETYLYNIVNSGYFHLITESNILRFGGYISPNDVFFITEKTIRTLIMGVPFVLIGSPNFIKHVRDLGFTTYSELWDESYDQEEDLDKRVEKVINLCNNLETFDWEGNKEKLKEISCKNFSNFRNMNKHIINSFHYYEKTMSKHINNDSI